MSVNNREYCGEAYVSVSAELGISNRKFQEDNILKYFVDFAISLK